MPESEGDTTVEGVLEDAPEVLEACVKVPCSLIAGLYRQPEIVERLS